MLYAFAATPVNGTLKLLYSGAAGQWPNLGGNANIVPMVANGLAYVAAYKSLTIFGRTARRWRLTRSWRPRIIFSPATRPALPGCCWLCAVPSSRC